MLKTFKLMIFIMALGLADTASAGEYDALVGYVQQMISQSAKNDEAGLTVTRQQLEKMSKPAHQNVKEARALNQQGLEALTRTDHPAAVAAFQQAQQADPADAEIAGNLGYAHFKLGQFKRAEHHLVYAISLAPGRSSSWYNLGQAYGAMDETEKALGAFTLAYRFSQNPAKTTDFMRQAVQAPENNATTRSVLERTLRQLGVQP